MHPETMLRVLLLSFIVVLTGSCIEGKTNVTFLSAVLDGTKQRIQLVPGKQQDAVAWASFQDAIHEDGWSYLEIRTNPNVEDEIAAYAAGALEGALTRELVVDHSANMFFGYCDKNEKYCDKLMQYFDEQLAFMNERSEEERYRSPFWNQVYLMLKQMAGLEDAYSNGSLAVNNKYTNVTVTYFLNNEGALYDLETAFGRIPDSGSINLVSPCSLLVKVSSDDVIIGHTAWNSYRSMLRVQKKYMFRFQLFHGSNGRVPGHTISMSSYPGKLNSLDDFYVVSTGLAVSETTNNVYNTSLYNSLMPTSVPASFRAMVANRLAEDGRHWTRIFEKHSSGTYNNQWVVIDYNKINRAADGISLANETFWMLEQLPNLIVSRDMTDVLRNQGYWASYNVPYFSAIYNESGYEAKFHKHGDHYSHENCPRAKIFQRDQFRVTDAASMISMLRYNDYKNDPLSRCNCTPPYSPSYAIAARYDLFEQNGHYDDDDLKKKPYGAIDAKAADSWSMRDFSFLAVSGPTNDIQPTFVWSESNSARPIVGQPDVFNFKPVRHKWSL